eukprot:CAMPEP_0194160804 /NCGR_PEP_ID=MMETSP0152-20130528/78586_1 /TAXON_ID=1049557 /ORGANISM="Thalassiothrix antarctica, Strain L6-D1" /LENGTH=510 /DNA_ID=CAMNT_0038870521 /DNA_START=732 /DNA_END=2261 /DNA_ORIENTATION=+
MAPLILNESSTKITAPPASNKDGSVPSGFILKLYQMVNGAPDDIITWTPDGDAFKIGADLQRLEAETLPQYFRHSRFQSLVRQLNFYNFRKVNRERTFWVYKHRLFHRERPEDLHLLRRRTCPGVDGRKNRFAGYPRKLVDSENRDDSFPNEANNQKSSDEESLDDNNESEDMRQQKACFGEEKDENALKCCTKEPKQTDCLSHRQYDENVILDLSLVESPKESNPPDRKLSADPLTSKENEGVESGSEVDERLARREQAHVVSQVALKLEEYARKAKRSLGRTRAGGGIVTPPLGGGHLPSGHYTRSLITYDDEYDTLTSGRASSAVTIVTDSEGYNNKECSLHPITPLSRRPTIIFDKPPVPNVHLVKNVSEQILHFNQDHSGNLASAAVACFCMSNGPDEQESEVCVKILELLLNCDKLAQEFMQYRCALQPLDCSSTSLNSTFCSSVQRNDSTVFSIHQIWERAASRRDAVRDFKTFAVNYINTVLQKISFSEEQAIAMQKTAEIW